MKRGIDLCDFTESRFIEDFMRYADIFDFVKMSNVLKTRYGRMSNEGKQFYKYFVYAHVNTTDAEKNAIWEYLNGDRKSIASYTDHLLKKKNML